MEKYPTTAVYVSQRIGVSMVSGCATAKIQPVEGGETSVLIRYIGASAKIQHVEEDKTYVPIR